MQTTETPTDNPVRGVGAEADVRPGPLRDLGAWLAPRLDEDQWPAAERLLCEADAERQILRADRDRLAEFTQEVRRTGDTRLASMAIAVLARLAA